MSPEPGKILPGSERTILFVQAAEIIRKAIERYQKMFPAERIGEYRVVGFVRESGSKELIHPLVLCRDSGVGKESELQLRALGRLPEDPCLATARAKEREEDVLEVYWGRDIGWRNYRKESPKPLLIGQTGNYFYLTRTSWPDYEGNVEEDLQMMMKLSSNAECQRLSEGIQNAMGIR